MFDVGRLEGGDVDEVQPAKGGRHHVLRLEVAVGHLRREEVKEINPRIHLKYTQIITENTNDHTFWSLFYLS